MDKTRGTGALLAIFLLGVMAWPATAAAGEMTWQVKSLYRHQVQIEFYSQDRKRAWPGGNRAYRNALGRAATAPTGSTTTRTIAFP